MQPPFFKSFSHSSLHEHNHASKFERLKNVCSFEDFATLHSIDATLSNPRSSVFEKGRMFAHLLTQFIHSKELTEQQLLRVFDYLLDKFKEEELTSNQRAQFISCMLLFCYRNFKEQLDCEVFEDTIDGFERVLRVHLNREEWEKAIAESINLILETHQFDFECLLTLLQISVQLIFMSKKENRDIWDEGPKRLIKDGIEKRLTFRVAETIPQKNIALAFVQVYISRHQIMVYNPREVAILLKLMNACKCSLYSIINMKQIMMANSAEPSPSHYHFYHACLSALGTTKFVSINDVELMLGLIHKEFHHLPLHLETRRKILETIKTLMFNFSLLSSGFSEEDINRVYEECATIFNIHPEWIDTAFDLCMYYYKQLNEKKNKDFENLILCTEIMARILLGREEFNYPKIQLCKSTLAMRLAVEISGANISHGKKHEAFDSNLIVRLVEELLVCTESNPQQTVFLLSIIRNPRLSTGACISILEMLLESKRHFSCDYLGQALQRLTDQHHKNFHAEKIDSYRVIYRMKHSDYVRLLKLLLNKKITFNRGIFGKGHYDNLIQFLKTPWKFDSVFELYDSRRTNPHSGSLLGHYFGDLRRDIFEIGDAYEIGDSLNIAEIVCIWMESLIDKIVDLKSFKVKTIRFNLGKLISLKQELLNLLFEFCRLIESLRRDILTEDVPICDEWYEYLYGRPQSSLLRLQNFRLFPPAVNEPEVFLVAGEFICVGDGNRIPLLKITYKEEV